MAETTDLEFDVPERLYERLRMLAALRSMTPEEYVREILEREVARPEPPEPLQR